MRSKFPITSWPRDPFGVQQPTKGQKPDIGSMANINHHKIFFPLTPNLIAFVSKYFSPMTSWSRDQQVPVKNVHGDFQVQSCSEAISKNKIQGQARCQLNGAYTLPMLFKMPFLKFFRCLWSCKPVREVLGIGWLLLS